MSRRLTETRTRPEIFLREDFTNLSDIVCFFQISAYGKIRKKKKLFDTPYPPYFQGECSLLLSHNAHQEWRQLNSFKV